MERTALRGGLKWQTATVTSVIEETAAVVTIELDAPDWPGRGQPPGWIGHTGRINQALLELVGWPAEANALTYICGPTSFVEAAAAALVGLGYPPQRVKTERFGATG